MRSKDTRAMMSSLEVCELLGVNLNNLRQMTHRGALTPIKSRVGKYKQYPRDEVLAYLAKRQERGKK